jgi:toxin-antitoxin system PIN domain toxin
MHELLRLRDPGRAAPEDLPDVNVWIALVHAGHPHHARARLWWAQRQGQVWFCRVTMLGLVRLLTQPRVMGEAVLGSAGALALYDNLAARPGVGLCAEPAGCEALYRRLVDAELPPRLLTDAYLCAFAVSAGLRLVTFDRDFSRFPGLHRLDLGANPGGDH